MGPLNLPDGSVRAIISIVAVVGTFAQWAMGMVVGTEQLLLVSVIATYYFATRGSAPPSEPKLPDPVADGFDG